MERAPEHPGHVGVDRRLRVLEREARDRARGVATDAGQAPERLDPAGDLTLVAVHHRSGEPVEILRPAIVA
jgi:hypothetical protein